MSLKGFHIVFIIFSTLLAFGCAGYCLWVNFTVGEPVYRLGAICSGLAGIALVIYGVWFYQKMKRLRIIT
jgi:hypothetical protein